jgi:3-hydroxybutyryl-CoA dehydratase
MEQSSVKTIKEINIGNYAKYTKTITEADVYQYAGIIGDFNPIRVNEEFAKKTPFKKRLAHGLLYASFISKIIGTDFPGPGSIHVAQEMNWAKYAYIGDTITTKIIVTKIDGKKNRVWIDVECTNQDGEIILTGEGEIMPPTEEMKGALELE